MSDSLIPRQSGLHETREESLTRQFYQWETRGRGWRLFPYPVELEPPFRPVYYFDDTQENPVDDGRVSTFFSRILEGSPKSANNKVSDQSLIDYRERLAELDEPVLCDYHEEDFREIQVILPKDFRITVPVARQFLLSLSHCRYPISFEIIGTQKQTVVQFASAEEDFQQLYQQLIAYFPGCNLVERGDHLCEKWNENGNSDLIVDFGLSNEFMMPLQTVANFDIDPLIALTGAMSDLGNSEVGVFQVILQKTRNNWPEEIMDSIRSFDGTPFFANAPEMVPLAKQKVSSPLFAAIVRVAARGSRKDRCLQIVRNLSSSFAQLSNPIGNEPIPLSNEGYDDSYHEQALLRRLTYRCGMILNCEELVSLVHLPSQAVRSEKLIRDSEITKAAPTLAVGHSLVLGDNFHQNQTTRVTLSDDQRTRHMHLIGASGSGKSTLLLSLIKQDMERGQGLCVIDPHGDLINSVVENIPESRMNDVILFDPSDVDYPIGFNILQARSQLEKNILSSDLVATFRRMSTSWGDVMDSVLANAILAFVESDRGGTLFELKRFLVEKDFRTKFLESVTDEGVVYFWENEFPLIAGKPQASILIRLDAFLRQSLIRNIVCQKENKLDFRGIMDSRKILLIKLSQGLIGQENAYLLGTMLVSRLYQAAISRQDSHDRPHFWLYLDEFHHFITPSMESILSGTRKYNLGLVLAHQEFRQLQARSQEVASSVLSNCYTRICFRLGDTDAEKFAGGFSFFDSKALQNLGVGEAIARVERADYDFNLKVSQLPAVATDIAKARTETIRNISRTNFARTKAEVEAELKTIREDVTKSKSQLKPETVKSEADSPPQNNAQTEIRQEKPKSPESGEHRYLQNIIKRIGESKGFVATIEKEVFGGVGKIDVALENENCRIACEIAVTNTTDYEVQNIQKCLSSGFDRMAVISTDTKHLQNIRKRAELILSPVHFSKVHFLEPENFHLFLDTLSTLKSSDYSESEKIKGYTVKTSETRISETETDSKKNIISDILSRVIKRKKRNEDE